MREIAAVVFDGFELLDLYGPLEMFSMADKHFQIRLLSHKEGPVKSGQGPVALPDALLTPQTSCYLLLVPGGQGTRQLVEDAEFLQLLKQVAQNAELVLSVCTGSALLAKAGLLDGRAATTNKYAWNWATSHSDKVKWRTKARWVEDGNYFTSSGVSAGMDMSLAVIAKLHGEETAEKAAFYAEYIRTSDPSDDPFAKAHGLVE